MEAISKDIFVPVIIGLIVNLFSAYLLSLGKINLSILLLVLIGSIVVIIILSIQLKTNKIKSELNAQKIEQQKLNEKLKIHEQLINIKAEIKELQKKVFKK